jgi:hypothetical protein
MGLGFMWFVDFSLAFLPFFGLTALVYAGLALSRIEITFSTETGEVEVLHRIWPSRGRAVLHLNVDQIERFGFIEDFVSDGEGGSDKRTRYGFWLRDGSTLPLTMTGSDALDHQVTVKVNLMLGLEVDQW